jgi:hypothetical protein
VTPPTSDADRLIVDLIQAPRAATPGEIALITDRIASAPFSQEQVRVSRDERGVSYMGYTLGVFQDSLVYHLVKRVEIEGQWVYGTTAEAYVADLRAAVRHPAVQIAVYERRGGHIAAVIAPIEHVVPAQRRGPESESLITVVYAADRGSIITGYQIAQVRTAFIPENALWLT